MQKRIVDVYIWNSIGNNVIHIHMINVVLTTGYEHVKKTYFVNFASGTRILFGNIMHLITIIGNFLCSMKYIYEVILEKIRLIVRLLLKFISSMLYLELISLLTVSNNI